MSSDTASVNELFESARDEGVLGDEAFDALQIEDLGVKINDAMGISADQVRQGEVVLVAVLVDDSGSIKFAGNTEPVADGYNCIIEALQECKQQDNIRFHGRLLNGDVICPFVSIDQAVKLTTGPGGNYNPQLGTPLYDQAVVFWGSVLAKAQEFSDQGVPCRTICVIISDGADQHSMHHCEIRQDDPSDPSSTWRAPSRGVKALATDMVLQENHIVAAMGINDRDTEPTDFHKIYTNMGIKDDWIMVIDSQGRTRDEFKSEIRRACHVFSQSAVRASQSAASFSQQAVGGFGS